MFIEAVQGVCESVPALQQLTCGIDKSRDLFKNEISPNNNSQLYAFVNSLLVTPSLTTVEC